MEIHIRPKFRKALFQIIQACLCANQLSLFFFRTYWRIYRGRERRSYQNVGITHLEKLPEITDWSESCFWGNTPLVTYIPQLRFRGCTYDFNYFKIRNYCKTNFEVKLSIFIQAKNLNHWFAKVYSLKKIHFSLLKN